MEEAVSVVEDKLHDALDEVAALKVMASSKRLRSAKQPPAKVRYDKRHYMVLSTIVPRRDGECFREMARFRGRSPSSLLRQFVRQSIGDDA